MTHMSNKSNNGTNKVASNTPRTDAEATQSCDTGLRSAFVVHVDFARELEREIERLTAERDEARRELRKAETESSMLRVECGVIAAERDEARRMWCEAEVIGNCLSVDDMKRLARAEAKRREWDCFEEDGK